MRYKILNIGPDDKFIDRADSLLAKTFIDSVIEWKIFKKKDKNLNFVQAESVCGTISTVNDEIEHIEIVNIDSYDFILVHYLASISARTVLKYSSYHRFVWIIWGADLYNSFDQRNILAPQTYRYVSFIKKLSSIKNIIFKRQPVDNGKLLLEAMTKLRYIGVLYREEFELLNKFLPIPRKHIHFFYYPLEWMKLSVSGQPLNNNKILIGNSAIPTNNHIDIFNKVKSLIKHDTEVVVPLSYGDKRYANYITRKGQNYFKNFNPLLDFVPLEEYQKIVNDCGVVIMYHFRQQAIGNIIASLYFGSKVFLSNKSSVYSYFKRIGLAIFSVENHLEKKELFTSLSREVVEQNKLILKKYFSLNNTMKLLKKDIDNLFGSNEEKHS